MSANILPAEILEKILENLSGVDVYRCRRVCQRWLLTADSLRERFWQERCEAEYRREHQEAYRKSGLSWRELYRSLSLWADVVKANADFHKIPAKAHQCCVLRNSILSYCDNSTGVGDEFDTIVYYDLMELKECHRDTFEFTFTKYAENDDLIVLEYDNTAPKETVLRLIPKADRSYTVETTINSYLLDDDIHSWYLHRDMVFIGGSERFLSVITMTKNEGITFEENELSGDVGDCYEQIMDVTGDRNMLHIITKRRNYYSFDVDSKIYLKRLVGTKLAHLFSFYLSQIDSIWSELDPICFIISYGFNWRSINLLQPMVERYSYKKCFSQCHHPPYVGIRGKIVLLLHSNSLNILYNCDKIALQTGNLPRGDRVIDFQTIFGNDFDKTAKTGLIDVIEARNGHKIILKHGEKVFFVELSHGQRDETEEEAKAELKQKRISQKRKNSSTQASITSGKRCTRESKKRAVDTGSLD